MVDACDLDPTALGRLARATQLGVSLAALSDGRIPNDKEFIMDFGKHRTCTLDGDKVQEHVVDDAFVGEFIIDGSKWRRNLANTVRELLPVFPGWKKHVVPHFCDSSSPAQSRAGSTSTSPQRPARHEGHEQQQAAMHGEEAAADAAPGSWQGQGGAGGGAGTSGMVAAAALAFPHKWDGKAFPEPGKKHVRLPPKPGKRPNDLDYSGKAWGEAEWYYGFNCWHATHGCPCRGVLFRPKGQDQLVVRLSHDCYHDRFAGPVAQCRGVAAQRALDRQGGRGPTAAVGEDLLNRCDEHRLDNTVSQCHSSASALSSAKHRARSRSRGGGSSSSYSSSGDELVQLMQRKRRVEEADRPDIGKLYVSGDTPLLLDMDAGRFVTMLIRQAQVLRWVAHRKSGAGGLYIDTTSGMVKDVNGRKVLNTIALHGDPYANATSSSTCTLFEVISNARDHNVYFQAFTELQNIMARVKRGSNSNQGGMECAIACRSVMPTFVYMDQDQALLNAASMSLNGRRFELYIKAIEDLCGEFCATRSQEVLAKLQAFVHIFIQQACN